MSGVPHVPAPDGAPPGAPELAVPPGLLKIFAPEEYSGGIGDAGVANLRAFVAQGGELITLNRASDFAIEKLIVGAKNIVKSTPPQEFYAPGSILSIHLDTDHPVGYGMDADTPAWFERGAAFAPSYLPPDAPAAKVIASFPSSNPLMSGWLLGAGLIENQGAVMDAPLGRGHVIMFGIRPQYRGQSYGTYKLLFNSLFYFELW